MKLWATIDLERLPTILQTGFDNPASDEILFYEVPEVAAEQAIDFESELAFIETEIPDAEVNDWFTYCVGITGDELVGAEASLAYMEEDGTPEEEKDALRRQVELIRNVRDGRTSFDAFGFACLDKVIPASMLKLLDPMTMIEAVHTGDAQVVAQAVREAEPQAFKSLGANFWVWLMLLLGNIMGPGYGIPQDTPPEALEDEARKAVARARTVKSKKKRKKTKPRVRRPAPPV